MFHKGITLSCSIIILITAIACDTPLVKRLDDGRSLYRGGKKISAKSVIDGRVVNSKTGRGISGARVEIKNANMGIGYYVRETDFRGYFKIDDFISQVQYVMEVTAEGYVTYRSTGPIAEGSQEVSLQPEAVLSGTVKDTGGVPMSGVEVKIKMYEDYYNSQRNKPQLMETNDTGTYRFDKLESGSYLVTFTKTGYITETARLQYIKEGETFRLPMVMIRPASVSGKLSIKDINVPAINVTVSIRGKVSYSTSTFQDGTYRLDDLKPGQYKLSISHQGFYSLETEVIQINEGQRRENLNFIVTPKEPKVNVYSYRYTFAPGNNLEFNLRTFRLESVRVTVYKVPIDVLMRGGVDPDKVNPKELGFSVATQWEEQILDFRPYEWRYQSLQIKSTLPTGGYCIEVRGAGKVISRKFFTLTSVGVVLKRSQESIFAYVTNLVTNEPVPNATVAVYDATPKKKKKRGTSKPPSRIEDLPVTVLLKGQTDGNGIFHRKLNSLKMLSALAVDKDGSYAICNAGSPSAFQREQVKHFIYTDRPVYRTGDTVYFKIIAKERKGRFIPFAGKKIYYKIVNRDVSKTLEEGSLTLDEWGCSDGKITLARTINLGEHEIRAGPSMKNLYSWGTFYVEQYRKPEFMIEITPAQEYFINGDTAEFKVEAKYFFGAPLKGAMVRYRFYETRLRDEGTSYWWEDDNEETASYNRISLEGEKFVDNNGIAVLRLFVGNYPYDREITLETTIVDKSNVSITSRKKVRVGRGEFYIKIDPSKNFFSGDETKTVTVQTLTQNGKPVSKKIKVDLFRYIWKPWQRVYVHDSKPVFSIQVTTDRNGKAVFDLPKKFQYYGEFDLITTGFDRRDNIITASRVLWIYSSRGGNIASKFKNLELALNATELKEPGKITCLVKSRYTDAYVCLTLEGRDVYESKVVKMTGNIMPVEFDIKPSYAPNLYLNAAMQRKRALYMASEGISLPVKDTELVISLASDKEKYLPGDTAEITLKAADKNGNPLSADLSMSAVDEAIYYIRYDHTPKMDDFFYSKISNWVLTSYSYPITVLAGAGKEDKVKVREKFEDTAFWSAKIRTDKNGMARVSFTLPDNLTTWRLTVRGHDLTGRVGEKRQKFLVTQDLIARIGRPRFFIEGDSLSLLGIVNSNTERGLKNVATEFLVNNKAVEAEEKASISLPPFGSARNYYLYTVPREIGSLKLQFTARADRKASDSLLLTVPVERRGMAFKMFGLGDMAGNRKITISPLKASGDFNFVPETVVIAVNPSIIVQMIRATSFLSRYPYGCVEQTLNSFIPNLALNRMLKQKGVDQFINKKAKKNLSDKVSVGINRIQQFQNDDGTWGWWSGGRGNDFITGYVLYTLHLSQEAGFAIQADRVKRGLEAVQSFLKDPSLSSPDAEAYLLYIYSLWDRWDHSAMKRIIRYKNLNSYQLAYCIRAMALAKKNIKTSDDERKVITGLIPQLIEKLKGMVQKDSSGLYWPSIGYQRWGWPGGNAEITAHVLAALVEAGDSSAIPAQIVISLAKRTKGDAWASTKETSTVILALCRYLEETGGLQTMKGNVSFTMDGTKLADFSYDLKDIKDMAALTKTIPVSSDQNQKEFIVEVSGEANPDMTFDATVAGTLYFKEQGLSPLSAGDRSINALSNGITITRSFSAITRVKDLQRNEYMVPQSLADKKVINVGDELLVKLKFSAMDNFEYLVLEDYLPSGFEVMVKNAYDPYSPYVHAERWDNRMVFFFTNLAKDHIYEVAYIVRAELPGRFMVRPARMECMYEPSIQGWSAPTLMEVKKK